MIRLRHPQARLSCRGATKAEKSFYIPSPPCVITRLMYTLYSGVLQEQLLSNAPGSIHELVDMPSGDRTQQGKSYVRNYALSQPFQYADQAFNQNRDGEYLASSPGEASSSGAPPTAPFPGPDSHIDEAADGTPIEPSKVISATGSLPLSLLKVVLDTRFRPCGQ